jgi:hypothetical protein
VPAALVEVKKLATTLNKRATGVLAYCDHRGTNDGPTEAINGKLNVPAQWQMSEFEKLEFDNASLSMVRSKTGSVAGPAGGHRSGSSASRAASALLRPAGGSILAGREAGRESSEGLCPVA